MEHGLKPMDAEQLRENAHKMVDFIADYYKNIEDFSVLSQVQQGNRKTELAKLLPETAPKETESLQDILDDVKENIFPGVTHWQSPGFFAYFSSNSSIAGFLGEMLSAGINMVGFSWITSPAATELEIIVLDWLAKLLNLPHYFLSTGWYYFIDSCGSADWSGKITKNNGIWFHVDAAYAGSACICPEFRHYLDGVEEADSFNMNAHKWFLTNFNCSALWVKVFVYCDYFYWNLLVNPFNSSLDVFKWHVWRTEDRNALIQSLSSNPEYLKNNASEANMVVDYKDWQIPLGRRFRSLKLWMVLRLYGLHNLQSYIRNHIELARHFEELLSQDSRFQIVTPRKFSLVCFRLVPPHGNKDCIDKLNSDLLDAVNSYGKLFISHTILSGKYTLRLAVGAPLTEKRHVNEAWKVLQESADILLKNI